ncbi:MAG: hypothetical protein JSW16_07750 [Dehalococcoidales bacterium]|nr:MAG: hypothetical protein JSW16_07750 [Dehalococcoidales bacterium]
MPREVERILESIRVNAGNAAYESVTRAGGEVDVRAVLAGLENTYVAGMVARVMKPCGYRCIPESFIRRAKSIYTEAESFEDFLSRLNETRIGGGKLHVKDGKLIGIYDQCYCSLAPRIKDLSPLYCHCSEGWYEKLFSSVLGKPVVARKLRTILDSSDECVFEISY